MGFRLGNIDGRAAFVLDGHYFDIAKLSGGHLGPDPMEVLLSPVAVARLSDLLPNASPTGALGDVTLGPPVPRPQKAFGIGLNYKTHAIEAGMDLPAEPLVFAKFPSCLAGPTATVEIRSDFCDYEGELVVVIGEGGKDIAVADAWNHVFGLTVGQDISDRQAQFATKPPQFGLGKSFDTFGPIGPFLVSVDSVPDRDALELTTLVNGEERQRDTTANLIFDIPTLVSYLSHITTLTTGDLIFTGTPEGIGFAQNKLLADGDIITTTIEGVGKIVNPVKRVSDYRD
ncbi:MAG: fumarylacetoacetate hydrolase family protein [Acidimicrobiales bacterium]|nr:fumarylacetoacetate hydrolase family protein [Acidimicrobiales bacterium]